MTLISNPPTQNSIFQFPPNFPNGQVSEAWIAWFQEVQANNFVFPAPQTGFALGWDAGGNLINVPNTGADQTAAWTAADAIVAGDAAAATALVRSDLASTATGKGAALVGYLPPYTGAAARIVGTKLGERKTLTDFTGCDTTGLTSSDAAFAAAIASFDKNIGGTLRLTPGYYRLGAQTIDGYNNLKIKGDEGAYILCTTTGDLFTILDCRRFTFEGTKIYGRANTTATQDNMPAFTGIVDPARVFYIHERQVSTRQSEFIHIRNCPYYGQAGTTVFAEVGNSAIASGFHQPSDVYFTDVLAADALNLIKVSQINCQAIYATRVGAGPLHGDVFVVTAGDLLADGVQVSSLAASAYMLNVNPAADADVKRIFIKNYWSETTGNVVKTNLKQIQDVLSIQVTRSRTAGLTWPFDIQCKNTTVRLETMDSAFSATGVATSFLRVNQATKLRLSGGIFTLAGQPTCTFAIIDDAAAVVDSFANQQGADSTNPLTNFTRPNLIPGAGGAAVLDRASSYGDGFTAFSVGTDGTISIDKKAAGTITAFTDYFDVVAGQVYTSSILMQENPIGTGYLWSMFFYDKCGTQITELATLSGTPNTLTTPWLGRSGTVTAPANAAYARVRIGLTGTGFLAYKNLKVEKGSFSTPFVVGPKRDPRLVLAADPVSGFWRVQDVYYKSVPASAGYVGKVCTVAGFAVKGAWTTGVAYAYGDYVSNAGKVYRCTSTSGNAGATAPTHTSGTVSDGTLDWLYIGTSGQPTWKDFGLIA